MNQTITKLKLEFSKLLLVLLLFGGLTSSNLNAQVSNYGLTASSGTFTPISGGTVMTMSGGNTDDGYYNNIPIGFVFNYDGGSYTTAAACTNGWLSLVGSMTLNAWTNNITSGLTGARPVLAPLWDDHDGAGITFTYKSVAVGSDSVFTAEWLDVDWQFQGGSTISFQVKLYKNSGNIQFIYRQEVTSLVNSTSASIGISSVSTGTGYFLSLNNSGTSPSTSSSVETTTITTKPATGQIYTFTPPVPAAPVVYTGTKTNITTNSVTLAGSLAASIFPAVTSSGIVIGTSPNPAIGGFGVIDSTTNPVITSGAFTKNIAGLTNSTTYYYRTYAVNSVGTSYGPDSTFTTNASAVVPSVLKTASSNVTTTTATFGGNVTSDGGSTIIASGVVYGTSPNPVIGGLGVVDSTTNPLVLTGTYSFTVAGLTHSTKYYYRAYATNAVGTAYSSVQDSFTTAPIVSALPYLQNFDGTGNTGWTSAAVTGTLNEWVLGTPAKTYINGAYSGTKSYVTALSGNYLGSDCGLVSPQFDFTSQTLVPVLRFKQKFDTDADGDWDGGVVEISINGGAWTRLNSVVGTGANFNTALSTSWYNNNTANGPVGAPKFSYISSAYSSQVNGWITSVTPLVGAAGQANVKVRFRFGADAFGTDEGWAVDDIEVILPTAPTMITGTKTNVTNNSVTLAGNITSNGNSPVTVSGIVIGTSPAPTIGGFGVIDSTTNPVVTGGVYTKNITGLINSTTYYYRAYAINAVGTTYGADSTFTTNGAATIATVTRNIATAVATTTANIGGTINTNGGDPVTVSGVVYSTTSNPVIGGGGVVDSTTTPLVSLGSFSFNIAGLTHSTKYYYRAYAINSIGTAYSTQDSFTTAPIISTLPYSQNFDGAGNTGWSSSAIGGGVNDWQLGTPAKTNISAAYSAPNAWVTKLTGNYSNNSYSGLVSPQFDFTTSTADPILRFRHKFRFVQTAIDGAIIEISINGGAWTQLDNTVGTGTNFNTTNSTSWYSANTSFWNSLTGAMFANNSTSYATQSNGWIQSTVRLTGAAGQSNVKVRMTFNSTTFTFFGVDEGWAVDNIEVFPPVAPTMLTGTKTNITTNQATLAGTILSNGNATITASGVVFSTTPSPTRGGFGVVDSATSPLVTSGSYTLNIAGLTNSTTYYYRAYAVNGIGTTYGADSTFTTNASAVVPSVLKVPATNITASSVTIGGNITSNGGDPVTASGIVYGITSNPSIGDLGVVDSTTNPLVAAGTYSFNTVGLTHSTKYYYRAYATNTVGTAYSIQDSFTTAPIISTLPYAENFDGATTPWTTQSINSRVNSWVRGTPAKTVINSAFSAPNAFITNLTANYGLTGDEEGALVSPQFNFSTLTQDPVLRFRNKIKTSNDPGWDAGIVEISLDGGTTWSKLNNQVGTGTNLNTLTSYAWYNSTSGSGFLAPNKFTNLTSTYASQTNGWVESATRLTGAAGQSNVKFRFHFAADAAGTDEGWAIDDIQVVSDVTPTIPTGTVTLTPNGTSVNVAFVPGNGQGRLVVARLTSATAVAPYDTVLYTANAVYGSGTLVGAGNYVVYNGTGSSVNVTGLTTVTGYSFDVYEYNGRYMHNKFAAASTNATTTLPVKLLSFTANNVDGNVQLKWVTANEINNKGFEIERSTDGKNFKSIDFVKGAGNTNKTSNYSKIDLGAFIATSSNVLYYRLKQVDFDGTATYTNQVVVNENELASNGVKVYPNPFTKTLTVDIASDVNTNTTIAITDISGKVISATLVPVSVGNNTTTLPNLDLLTAGIYFVKVSNGTKAEVFKVVKY